MAGIYIHIPFCKSRCHYCDFYSCIIEKDIPLLVENIIKEIDHKKEYARGEVIETIYFGGGTPSFIKTEYIKQILNEIHKKFSVLKTAEITIEVNPDDITPEKTREYKTLGIERISMGIQSFDDNILRFMGRRHNTQQALIAIEILKNTGFKNISLDLMYGVPDLSHDKWNESLEQVVKLNIQHISAYHLTIEKGTVLHKMLLDKKISITQDHNSVQQYLLLTETLKKHGFLHYEISNFAKPGFESKHNSGYWHGNTYIGLGPSAHSFNGKSRQWNITDIHKYMDGVHNVYFYFKKESLTKKKRYNEFILTRFRTSQGIQPGELEAIFGKDYFKFFLEGIQKHLSINNIVHIVPDNYIIPEDKWFISDGIISDLFKV